MQEPLETAELLAFSRIVETLSLSKAAIALRVPRATISRRLARLEERLSVRLLRRTTRSMVVTDAGKALYGHAKVVLDAVSQAEASLRTKDDAICGEVRVSTPPIRDPAFSKLVIDFCREHPNVRLHVHASTGYVDLRRDPFDLAIRASIEPLEPGLVAKTLVKARMYAVASPGYLKAHGTPKSVKDLTHHRCLLGFARGEVPQTHWPLAGGGKIAVQGIMYSNELLLLLDAVLAGLGIALMPAVIVEPYFESEELIPVLPDAIGHENRISLVYPERELTPPQVRAFIDAISQWAPTNLSRAMSRPLPTKPRARKKKR